MNESRLLYLFKLYHAGKASETESGELMHLLENVPEKELEAILKNVYEAQDFNQSFFLSSTRENLMNRMSPAESFDEKVFDINGGRRKVLLRFAAAAAVIVVISLSIFLSIGDKKNNDVAVIAPGKEIPVQDIAPGGDKAILTLADGTQIVLDTAENGAVTQQGGIQVIKLDGQLTYQNGESTEVLYNTISTPKGGQYQLMLSDGTKVWLNSDCSLRFPTSFDNVQRVVELKGEGYFEVAANSSKPFHVKTATQNVEVLGTHFNINSYEEDASTKTTLLEGSVKVTTVYDQSVKLKPGQQAEVEKYSSKINVNNNIDIDHVMAWKNGWFEFENTDLTTIMKQISRWYDVDIVYSGKPGNKKFGGRISKNMLLSKVLHLLETNGVKFKLEGKKLIVQP